MKEPIVAHMDIMKKTTFLLPAYNEEKSIGYVLKVISESYPDAKIIVVDNNCDDKTPEIAASYGATVIHEKRQGKGFSIKKGLETIDSEYIIMLDADNTYDPNEALKLLKSLKKSKSDVILGNRLTDKRCKDSITRFNLIGNYILSFLASILYSKISDVCTGYWVFNRGVKDYILNTGIESNGFELEVEIFAKINNANFKIHEIPINYRRRVDKPKLSSARDGWKIFKSLWYQKIKFIIVDLKVKSHELRD
ncbi:glycosyltransferase family 2 protein [uncultured Methanobacterium sp.]|uniref:glycosyltransferase family 2 protein n=1 Tax=uncultured Methanobacterium sp. TaxID=176306 RepID=UPI002AA7EA8E|nr:glycosyltransferase family 2 protein [uncultured Methanobacterium sp.]